jgi:hypothetical protein
MRIATAMLNRRIILYAILFALMASARPIPARASGDREFVGTINTTLKVRMRLSQSGTRLTGSYAYERIGKSLRLTGAMTSERDFYLNEFDERGTQTGRFEGQFVSKDWLEGTWSSTGTKRGMPFSAWADDGRQVPAADPHDRVSGQYRRVDNSDGFDRDSAALNLWLLKDGQVRVAGDSSWIGSERTGYVNVGHIDGIVALQDDKLSFKDGSEDSECRFTITWAGDALVVTDDNLRCGGLNVTFDGRYRRVDRRGSIALIGETYSASPFLLSAISLAIRPMVAAGGENDR